MNEIITSDTENKNQTSTDNQSLPVNQTAPASDIDDENEAQAHSIPPPPVEIPPEIDRILEETEDEGFRTKPSPLYDIRWFASQVLVFLLTILILAGAGAPLLGVKFHLPDFKFNFGGSKNLYETITNPTNSSGSWEWNAQNMQAPDYPSKGQQANSISQNQNDSTPGLPAETSPGELPQLESVELKGKCGFEELEPSTNLEGIKVTKGAMKDFGSFYKLFKTSGINPNDGSAILSAMGKFFDPKTVRAEDIVSVYVKPSNDFWFLELRHSQTSIFHFLKTPDGKINPHRVEFPTRKEWSKGGGVVHGSIFRSAEMAGLDGSIAGKFAETLGAYINFAEDTRDGDIFKVIVAGAWVGEKFMSYDPPQALYYKGDKAGEITAIRFPPEGDVIKYYKPDGLSLKEVLAEVPLKTIRVTSPFNLRRFHPILKVIKPHEGVDLGAPIGTPIYAFDNGIVKTAQMAGPMGNMVVIDHGSGILTYYGHLNGFARGIKSGVSVKRGELIGYVGSTGRSTGPHLHFGYKKNNVWLDPMKFLKTKTTEEKMIDASMKEAFFKRAKAMIALLDAIEVQAPQPEKVKQKGKQSEKKESEKKQSDTKKNEKKQNEKENTTSSKTTPSQSLNRKKSNRWDSQWQ